VWQRRRVGRARRAQATTRHRIRLIRTLTALLAVITLTLVAPGTAGWATDTDGDDGTLASQVEEISQQLNDAKMQLAAAQARQQELQVQMTTTNLTLARLTAAAGAVASAMYTSAGGVSEANVVLGSTGPADLLDRLSAVHVFAEQQSLVLKDLKRAKEQGAHEQEELANAVAAGKNATAQLTAQRAKLSKLLGGAIDGPKGVVIPRATASQAPRNPDGSWPKEPQNQDDPTTSGHLTARTVHAYNEVKKATVPNLPGGFNHFVSCWRTQSWGEHPKGRACDWAAAKSGFAGVATGSDYTYGALLAGWLIGNSEQLGVMYVIWFKMIWTPDDRGWHKYTTEGGNPSGDHTNHVHMSIY
jgi:peptidoglycan DL-endopeptidase CwlO